MFQVNPRCQKNLGGVGLRGRFNVVEIWCWNGHNLRRLCTSVPNFRMFSYPLPNLVFWLVVQSHKHITRVTVCLFDGTFLAEFCLDDWCFRMCVAGQQHSRVNWVQKHVKQFWKPTYRRTASWVLAHDSFPPTALYQFAQRSWACGP